MKKKGLTLDELLAVITIFALILEIPPIHVPFISVDTMVVMPVEGGDFVL